MSRVLSRNNIYTTAQLDLLTRQNIELYSDVPPLGTTLWLHVPVDDPETGAVTDTVIEVRPIAYRFTDPSDAYLVTVSRIAGTDLWQEIMIPEAVLSSSATPLTFEIGAITRPVVVDEPAGPPKDSKVIQFNRKK